MLTSIQLVNWRGHIDTTVPLSEFTVLVGANAVGKTAVLEGIDVLGRRLNRQALNLNRSPTTIVRHGTTKCALKAAFDRTAVRSFGFELLQSGNDSGDLTIWIDRPDHVRKTFRSGEAYQWHSLVTASAQASIPFFAIPTLKRIAAASKVSRTSVESDGFGTASTLAAFKINDDERFHRIVTSVRQVIPQVEGLILTPAVAEEFVGRTEQDEGYTQRYRRVEGYSLWVKFKDGAILPADAVSEGTLLAIATLTMVESSAATVLLIDDIDRALHMRAQADFVKVLRAIQKLRPHLQIIATTHSPLIVQHFEDDEVVVMAQHENGQVAAKKLSEHPDRKRYASLSAAELWVAEQEDWVLKP